MKPVGSTKFKESRPRREKSCPPRRALLAQHWTATRARLPTRGSRQSAELPPPEPGILPLRTTAPSGTSWQSVAQASAPPGARRVLPPRFPCRSPSP